MILIPRGCTYYKYLKISVECINVKHNSAVCFKCKESGTKWKISLAETDLVVRVSLCLDVIVLNISVLFEGFVSKT